MHGWGMARAFLYVSYDRGFDRHGARSAMAASAAYDKHGSDRVVAAAVKAADEFAKRFAF